MKTTKPNLAPPPKVKPVIKWPGGKTRLLKHLLPLPPHTCFVEAFAGGAALLLAKQPSPVEVLNDLNGDLINLYRQLKYHAEAVIAELQWMPFSRELMREWIANPGLTEIQRAARWIRCNSISFGGGGAAMPSIKRETVVFQVII